VTTSISAGSCALSAASAALTLRNDIRSKPSLAASSRDFSTNSARVSMP
jgi:hypothetical protein